MNKEEFLDILKDYLKGHFSAYEIDDILRDYEEFFINGKLEGKSEEEVAKGLGSPKQVATELIREMKGSVGEENYAKENIDTIKSEEFNHRENNMKNEIIPYSRAYSIKDEKNKKVNNVTNKYEVCEDEKYTEYLNNSLMYFDVVKLKIYSYNLDEVEEQNILKYLDALKNEYIYLFTTTLDYNDKKMVLKMLKSLDSLISKKVEKKEKIYTKKAA